MSEPRLGLSRLPSGECTNAWAECIGIRSHGMEYSDPGASHYEERYRRRVLTNLERRAKSLGYVLQEAPAPA